MQSPGNRPKAEQENIDEFDRKSAELAEWRRLQPRLEPGISSISEYRERTTVGRVLAAFHLQEVGAANPNPEVIRTAHQLVFDGVTSDSGRFRQPGEAVIFGGRQGADAQLIDAELIRLHSEMADLLAAAQTSDDFCAAVAFYHARFIAIHPFNDGNGRIGRAIMVAQCNLLGLRCELGWILQNKREYVGALGEACASNDIAPLARVVANCAGLHFGFTGRLTSASKIGCRAMRHVGDVMTSIDERRFASTGRPLPLPSHLRQADGFDRTARQLDRLRSCFDVQRAGMGEP